ncbi:hypothetical protein ACO0LV_09860 [Pseudactinotalea sp. Z1739]|uniref:hypothetical protein n=1 Tax=Pseudactinotalea sp. Z1739 TaxID=3413028 RepID=UPI003C7A0C17
MSLTSGLRLTILAGHTLPVPLPFPLADRVRSVTVTESDEERSAFSIVFDAAGPAVLTPFNRASPLAAFSRAVLVLTVGAVPHVLFDGIVTEGRLEPGTGGRKSTWVITGEDLGNLLDREERDVEHAGLDDYPAVLTILAPYAGQGLLPQVIPPPSLDPPLPIDRIPTQHGTDLAHLSALAGRHGYVAYATPGPVPGTSLFYWGPPVRLGAPQPALAVDLGHDSNVKQISFRTEASAPTTVSGNVMDRRTGVQTPVHAPVSLRPPLAAVPFTATNVQQIRTRRLRDGSSNPVTAQARAQGQVEVAADNVSAEGSADGVRYGSVLRARGLVGLRGAGWDHDGLWYAKRVEHTLTMGAYTVGFTLTREGHGSVSPVLPRAAS